MDTLWDGGIINDLGRYIFSFATKIMGERKNISEDEKRKLYLAIIGFGSLALVVLYIMFIDVPNALIYARSGLLRWLPFVLIFGAFPYSVFKAIGLIYPKYSFLIAIGSLLVIGPLFGMQLTRFDEIALSRDGEVAEGIITKKWEFKPGNREPEWLVQVSFDVNGQIYETHPQVDATNELKENQEMKVMYSKRNPAINLPFFIYKSGSE